MALDSKSKENLGVMSRMSVQMEQTLQRMEKIESAQLDVLLAIEGKTGGGGGGKMAGMFEGKSGGDAKQGLADVGSGLQGLARGIKDMAKGLALFAVVPGKKSFLKFLKGFLEVLDETGADPKKVKAGGEAVAEMGKGILTLGLSLAAATLLFMIGIPGLLVAIPVIWVLSHLFAWVGKRGEQIDEGSRALIYAGLSIASVAIGLWVWEMLDISIGTALMAGLTILIVGAAFALIGLVGGYIELGATAMLFTGLAIMSVALGIAFFRLLDIGMEDVIQTGLMIAGVGIAFALVGLMALPIALGAIALMLAGFSMIFLSLGLGILGLTYKSAFKDDGLLAPNKMGEKSIFGNVKTNLQVMVDGVANGFMYAGLLSPFIILGSVAIILASVSMMMLSLGIGILSLAFNRAFGDNGLLADSGVKNEGIMGMGGGGTYNNFELMMRGVADAFFIAGINMPFIVLGSVAIMLGAISMMLLAPGIMLMSKAYNGSGSLFEDSGEKTESFMGFGGGRVLLNFEKIMNSIVDGLVIGPIDLMMLYASVPAHIMTGFALMSIAAGINDFIKFGDKIEGDTLLDNIVKVTKMAGLSMVAAVTGVDSWETIDKMGTMEKLGLFAGGSLMGSLIANAAEDLQGVGNTLRGLAEGVQAMANLKFPIYGGVDEDGNAIITGYFGLEAPAMDKMTENMKKIILAIGTAFIEVGQAQEEQGGGGGWFEPSLIEKGKEAIMGIGGDLSQLADFVQKMADFRIPVIGADGKVKEGVFKKMDDKMLDDALDMAKQIIMSISGAFTEIGKSQGETSWFSSSDAEEGKEIIVGIGQDVNDLAEAAEKFAQIKDIKKTKIAIQQVLGALPSALINIGKKMEDVDEDQMTRIKKGIAMGTTLFEFASGIVEEGKFPEGWEKGYVDGITNVMATVNDIAPEQESLKRFWSAIRGLGKIADYEDPLEKVAKNFGKFAKEIGKFSKALGKMNVEKMDNFRNLSLSLVALSKADPKNFQFTPDFINDSLSGPTMNTGGTQPTSGGGSPGTVQPGQKPVGGSTGSGGGGKKKKAPEPKGPSIEEISQAFQMALKGTNTKLDGINNKLNGQGIIKTREA